MRYPFDVDPEAWTALRSLLDVGMALPAAAREAWLRGLPPPQQLFVPRLRALLAHEREGEPGDGPAPPQTLPKIETLDFVPSPALAAGEIVGPYRLLRPLGEGGMGSVWLAERADGLLQRPVALKLPRLLGQRPALAERLARERDFLAALDHPHIARLYDAGVDAQGRPYLALEYIEGQRIDAHAEARQLGVRERLRLIAQAASAVAHAHTRLILHRDLKPANILVDADGQVKLLDFGIAKLIEAEGAATTELTRFGGRALTPTYASPEQIAGRPLTVASDVYSLGVVLYELLAGRRPHRPPRDTPAALEEAILNADVPPPSTVAADRTLRQALRGDLDTIVCKALKRPTEERYATVAELLDDLQRFLDQRPVLARPDSFGYRAARFLARHRGPVAIGAAVFASVGAAAVVAAWQAQRATQQQQRAEQVKSFIVSVIADADPYADESAGAATVVTLLNRAEERVNRELSGQPEVRAEMLRLIGKAYAGQFELVRAERVLASGIEATLALRDTHDTRLAAGESAMELGEVKKQLGKLDEARALVAQALAAARPEAADRRASDLHADAKLLEAGLSLSEGRYPEVVAAAEEAIRVSTQAHGEANRHAAFGWGLIAKTRGGGAEHQQRALEAARKSFELFSRLYPPSAAASARPHPFVVEAREGYGVALLGVGELKAAESHLAQALAEARLLYGERNPMAGHFAARLGQIHLLRGELERGLQEVRMANEQLAQGDPGQNVATAGRLRTQALGSLWLHRPQEALAPLQAAIEILAKRRDLRALLVVRADEALALLELGRRQEAAALLTAIEAEGAALQPPERPLRALARLELARGNAAAAKPLLQRALDEARRDPRRPFLTDTLIDLGRASLELAEFDAAAAHAREALAVLERTAVAPTPQHALAWTLLGRVQQHAGAQAEALACYERAARVWDAFPSSRAAARADNEQRLVAARRVLRQTH